MISSIAIFLLAVLLGETLAGSKFMDIASFPILIIATLLLLYDRFADKEKTN